MVILEGPRLDVRGSSRPGHHVIDRCVLCLERKRLLLSHIAPRWAFKWMKDEGYVITRLRQLGVEAKSQDGYKEYLLCRECEAYLGEAENYLARLCRGAPKDLSTIGVELTQGPGLNGVDRRLLMRALLGIALKSHWSTSPGHSRIRLPKEIRDSVREWVKSDDYSSPNLALTAVKWYGATMPDANPKSIISIGMRLTKPEQTCLFTILLGGFSWYLALRGGALFYTSPVPRFHMLRPNSWWPMMVGDLRLCELINPDWEREVTVSLRDVLRSWAPEAPCPCGIGRVGSVGSFDRCCRHTWLWSEWHAA